MQLELSEAEAKALATALDAYLPELRRQAAAVETGYDGARRYLWSLERTLSELRQRLREREAQPSSEAPGRP